MRSRYSAYASSDFQYIADTYATKEQCTSLFTRNNDSRRLMSAKEIKASSLNTNWCKLEIVYSHQGDCSGEVEFIAYYQHNGQFFAMHERSRFVNIDGTWLYVDGQMLGKTGRVKLGRNDSCLCGSDKKFKRCCQA